MKTIDWTNPYQAKGNFWLKGNLHAHTCLSDGQNPPEKVFGIYEKMGYHFLSVTDHRRIFDPQGYKSRLILLAGVEADFNHKGHTCIVSPQKENIVYAEGMTQQTVLTENAKNGCLSVLNHPDWEIQEHYPLEQLQQLTDYQGIEIYNSVIDRLEGSALSTAKWDRLLAAGKKVLGFANQDSHETGDYADCCNVVHVQKPSAENVLDALVTGNFYCYYGVKIDKIGRTGDRIAVETKNAKVIRFIGWGGKMLKSVRARKAQIQFAASDSYRYVRIECLGVGGEISWSQPFFRE